MPRLFQTVGKVANPFYSEQARVKMYAPLQVRISTPVSEVNFEILYFIVFGCTKSRSLIAFIDPFSSRYMAAKDNAFLISSGEVFLNSFEM